MAVTAGAAVPRRASSEEVKPVEVMSSDTNCPSASPTSTSRRSHLAADSAIASYLLFLSPFANVAVRPWCRIAGEANNKLMA